MIINGDRLTSAEWDVLGKETGRMLYQVPGSELRGALPATDFDSLRKTFWRWDEKPRIFREFEGGEIEITKDVWK